MRPTPLDARSAWLLAGLLTGLAACYGWTAFALFPYAGYDGMGHAAYALAIRTEGGLPHPLSGWSTFHPPLYHLIAAALWPLLEPFGGRTLLAGLRGISALAILAVAAVVFVQVRRSTGSLAIAGVATALVGWLPAAQIAATMVGNEALGAGLAALALAGILALQRDPRRAGIAAATGLAAGLALATKYTGAWIALACAVPFLRRDLDRTGLRALAVCAGCGLLVAAPVFVRNLDATGSLLPMTRDLEPMASMEAKLAPRERWLSDYVTVSADCWNWPFVQPPKKRGRPGPQVNPAMQSVPCLTYVSLWYDPFSLRAFRDREGRAWGITLLLLGMLPTAICVAGLVLATRDAWRSRGRALETPAVVVVAAGTASFLAWTWRAPSLAGVKGAYLLPLLAPAALLYARGCRALWPGPRRAALAVSLLAALASAVAFTADAVFPGSDPFREKWGGIGWLEVAKQMPTDYMAKAMQALDPPKKRR